MAEIDTAKAQLVDRWLKRIQKAKEAHKPWKDEASRVYEIYREEQKGKDKQSFNILWSNTDILHSALFNATPAPDVRRRFVDAQDEEKELSLAIERALSYLIDQQDFASNVDRTVDDFLVAGLGQCRLRYEADVMDDDTISSQFVWVEHVAWNHFHWEPNRAWEDVEWVAFEHWLSKAEIKQQFGEIALATGEYQQDADNADKCCVYEIWHRPQRAIYVIAKGFDEPLEIRRDALGLKGFYPCPKPLLANLRTDKMIPRPDYCYYEKQANTLNQLAKRVQAIAPSIKNVGFYDAQLAKDMDRLTHAKDGEMIPITNLMERLNGSANLEQSAIAYLPIQNAMAVLGRLYDQIEIQKQQIYELTGISDIVRGATQASETATAQQIKGQWANARLQRKQKGVNEFIRDLFRMMAEVVCEHFQAPIVEAMTGVQLTPEMDMARQNDILRSFAIDVETESTVAGDRQADQQQRMAMLKNVSDYLNVTMPAVQNGIMPADLANSILSFAVKTFKHGRELEDAINALPGTQQQMQQQAQQAQQQIQQMQQQVQQYAQAYQQLQQQFAQLQKAHQQHEQQDQQRENAKAQAEVAEQMAQAQENAAGAALDQAKADEIRARMMAERPAPLMPMGPGGAA